MQYKQRKHSLEQIADAVSSVSGIDIDELFSKNKDVAHTTARGVFFMLARRYGYLFQEIADYTHRHHSTIVNVSQRFCGYYEVKDKQVCCMVHSVEAFLVENM